MTLITEIRLGIADYAVIAVYFLVLLGFGLLFKNMNKNTKDYFAGSGSMLWWLVGATAFMNMFSAWTFTGASGQAYRTGFQVSILFIGNAVGYVINSLFVGGKIRQMAVVTPVELIRRRYGKVNEQIFTWTRFPISLIQAGTWLSALGVFMSSAFNWEPAVAVIICGIIVTVMTLMGGSWAVIASDYLQMLVVMMLSIATAVVILITRGGLGNIVETFNIYRPEQNFMTSDYNIIPLFVLWTFFTICRSILSVNNMYDSYRYLCASDTKNAQKGARLAGVLMILGAIIWFVPSWAASSTFQESQLVAMFPNLKNIGEATYLVMVNQFMPVGLTGLLLAGVFAATMSSMDSALNTNAGIFIRNFYNPIIKKGNAKDSEMMMLSKVTVVVFGCCVVGVGLFINTLKDLTLFDIMLRISSLIMVPAWIPLFFGFFIKKVPDWAAWATLLVGAFVSAFNGTWLNAIIENTGLELMALERKDLSVTFATICHLTITTGFYLSTMFLYKEGKDPERDKERDQVFVDFKTPVVAPINDETKEKYFFQRQVLGRVSIVAGCVVGVLAFMPGGDMVGRVVVFCAGGGLAVVGLLLRNSRKTKTHH